MVAPLNIFLFVVAIVEVGGPANYLSEVELLEVNGPANSNGDSSTDDCSLSCEPGNLLLGQKMNSLFHCSHLSY